MKLLEQMIRFIQKKQRAISKVQTKLNINKLKRLGYCTIKIFKITYNTLV